ncbi:MAG: hypothetical protein P8J86_08220 [Phycisphaerales bacterium]|nr:hypothetical protein [Phycisphaerales bacterium]
MPMDLRHDLIVESAYWTVIATRSPKPENEKGIIMSPLTSPITLFSSLFLCLPAMAFDSVPVDQWEWELSNADAPWAARAGLQVVDIDGDFYLMGGRTPNAPGPVPIPGDSVIWSDVWKSTDQGGAWNQLLESDGDHWPARAYFRAEAKGDQMFVMGGQNFILIPNPECPPPYKNCSPFISASQFFNDVWSSTDGVNWTQRTAEAGWSGRAGLSSAVMGDDLYVIAGSYLDDDAIIGGPPARIYYNDVWKSSDDGETWTQMTEAAPFEPRAGAAVAVKDGYIYLFGGEEGFLCQDFPFCKPPYFNDVWRSANGADWELVTARAPWPSRPGHQVVVADDQFVLFGGFGQSADPTDPFGAGNPMDVWVSSDGADWQLASTSPWNATTPEEIKYDFAALAVDGSGDAESAIFTFGGDRETFDFSDPTNYLNIDNDVWRFAAPAAQPTCFGDIDGDGMVGVGDVFEILVAWGPCQDCDADLSGNGRVGIIDFILVLIKWGPCPE